MMNLELSPKEAKDRWDQISGRVEIITKDSLWWRFGIDHWMLQVQDGMDTSQHNVVSLSLLDR